MKNKLIITSLIFSMIIPAPAYAGILSELVTGSRNKSDVISDMVKLPIGLKAVVSENSVSSNILSGNVIHRRYFGYNPVSDNCIIEEDPEAISGWIEDGMYIPEPVYEAEDYLDEFEYKPGEGEKELLAKLIWHETDNQVYEGKVAVAELVMNRVYSDLFPDNIRDVISQEKQFLYDGEIDECPVIDEYLEIAGKVIRGEERIFYNPDVMYFRNPYVTSEIEPCKQTDWDEYPWYGFIGDHAFYTQYQTE